MTGQHDRQDGKVDPSTPKSVRTLSVDRSLFRALRWCFYSFLLSLLTNVITSLYLVEPTHRSFDGFQQETSTLRGAFEVSEY